MQASVENHSGAAVRLLEVDYPTASFGTGELADGAVFNYRFKILGNGAAKVQWTDPSSHEHTAKGPELQEGEEGTLTISLQPDGAHWATKLHPVR